MEQRSDSGGGDRGRHSQAGEAAEVSFRGDSRYPVVETFTEHFVGSDCHLHGCLLASVSNLFLTKLSHHGEKEEASPKSFEPIYENFRRVCEVLIAILILLALDAFAHQAKLCRWSNPPPLRSSICTIFFAEPDAFCLRGLSKLAKEVSIYAPHKLYTAYL